MRFAAFALICMLAACSQDRRGCDIEVTIDLAFTSVDAHESVTARALGAECDKAIGVYAVQDHEGRPIWSWSAPLEGAFGEAFPAGDRAAMRAFLERWARPSLAATQAAPEWVLLAPGQTSLDRMTYEDIRARSLPMLCHYSGSARETCVFWEPAAGQAGHFFDRDAPDPEPDSGPDPGPAPQ